MTAASVMDEAAVLLNDASKQNYTYTIMQPLLSKANDELESALILSGISVTKKISSIQTLAKGVSTFAIPADLADPLEMWERAGSSADQFTKMTETSFPPEEPAVNELVYWSYLNLVINVGPAGGVGATVSRDAKLLYSRLLTSIINSGSVIEITKSKTFLAERTAALCAEFLGENPSRAQSLNFLCFGPEPDRKGGSIGDVIIEFVRNGQGTPSRRMGYKRPRVSR